MGKPQRPIVVVFGTLRTLEESKQLTPNAEFTGVIPNPVRPRGGLKPSDPLPARFTSAAVKRNDDEIAMAEHDLWVASLRDRF